MKTPRSLEPHQVTAVIDTREQLPLQLSPLRSRRGTLATGDYSIAGLEHCVSVERKSLDDLLGCIGGQRGRFERELQRLMAYPVRAVVVEATWGCLAAGGWRSQVTPASATGSVLAWMAQGVPFLFVGSHDEAGRAVSRFLFLAARRRWRELQAFQTSLVGTQEVAHGEGA